ncbi:Gfo/Idh/MocA family protein [Halosimplex salinum]|uniref:Gfo/Idh/MocA family protein n=1 Tax=Halosimplex salinum TaxID=1710538 RepID=UPI001F427A1E|nr:Gfo/Idh/MocA family oxidoreductase [Halosimplex salinum]
MTSHDIAFIGTGDEADLKNPGPDGFAMNYYHAEGYERLDDCELVACADLEPERADAFAARFDVEETFEDYETMLAEAEPDIVSISVWPDIHADVVIDCARAPSVDAIHCEKPMDLTWGNSRLMAQVCDRRGVQLTFNHMRRFKPTWVEARERVQSGAIGDLERVELSPGNIYDGGTHMIDFATGVVGDVPAEWVIGQIDYREANQWFGAHNENQAHAHWRYENGVDAVISTGVGSALVPADMRFVGSDGVLEVGPEEGDADLRWRTDGDEWTAETVEEGAWTDPIDDAVAHVVDCLESGEEPSIGARNALNTTEIIFGVWESARRRGRVDFPLEIDDNPLEAMVEAGDLQPQ